MRGATELSAYDGIVWVIRVFLRVDIKVRHIYIYELEKSKRTYVTPMVQQNTNYLKLLRFS